MVMLCYVMLCYVVLCYVMLRHITLHCLSLQNHLLQKQADDASAVPNYIVGLFAVLEQVLLLLLL
jgi:hypothetical protein